MMGLGVEIDRLLEGDRAMMTLRQFRERLDQLEEIEGIDGDTPVVIEDQMSATNQTDFVSAGAELQMVVPLPSGRAWRTQLRNNTHQVIKIY